MEGTVKERIIEFLKYIKIGQNTFESKIGWSNGYISNTKHISADKLKNVANEYPQLSLIWLITGKGEMIVETGNKVDIDQSVNIEKEYLDILRENRQLRIKIEEYLTKIGELEKELSDLNELVVQRSSGGRDVGTAHEGRVG